MDMLILKSIIFWWHKNTLFWWEILWRVFLLFNIRHFLFHHRTDIRNVRKTKLWSVVFIMLILILVHDGSKVFTLLLVTFLAQVILFALYTFVSPTNYRVNFTIITKISMMDIMFCLLFDVFYSFLQLLQGDYTALWSINGLA